MDRDQLIDLTRRAVKLARDKTTDLMPSEHTVMADSYTSADRLAQDTAMLLASPQLVGYASELPRLGTYCTKTVMGRSIMMTRVSDGSVRAFDNICLHRQSRIVEGCGQRAAAGMSVPFVDLRPGRQSGRRAGQRRISRNTVEYNQTDRAPGDRVCGFPVDLSRPGRDAGHPHSPRAADRRIGVVGHRTVVAAGREGAGLPDQLEARDRHVRRELSLRDGAQDDVRDHRPQQLHGIRFVRCAPPACLPAQWNSRPR